MPHRLTKEEVEAFWGEIDPSVEQIKHQDYFCKGGRGGHHFGATFLLKVGESTPVTIDCEEHPQKSPRKYKS